MAQRLVASASDHGSYYEAVLLGVVAVVVSCVCFAKRHPEDQSATGITHRDRDITPLFASTLLCVRDPLGGKKCMSALVALLIDL